MPVSPAYRPDPRYAALPAGFFEVKQIGAITMGVGSALDEKYLIIFEGETPAAADDLALAEMILARQGGNAP